MGGVEQASDYQKRKLLTINRKLQARQQKKSRGRHRPTFSTRTPLRRQFVGAATLVLGYPQLITYHFSDLWSNSNKHVPLDPFRSDSSL